jgi:hypothetical protein
MIHEDYIPARVPRNGKPGSLFGAYIVGVLGAGVLIAVGLVAGTESGWLEHAQTEVSRINLRNAVAIPESTVSSLVDSLTESMRTIGSTASTSLEKEGQLLQMGGTDTHSQTADRKN